MVKNRTKHEFRTVYGKKKKKYKYINIYIYIHDPDVKFMKNHDPDAAGS